MNPVDFLMTIDQCLTEIMEEIMTNMLTYDSAQLADAQQTVNDFNSITNSVSLMSYQKVSLQMNNLTNIQEMFSFDDENLILSGPNFNLE